MSLQGWVARAIALAKKHNIHPLPFLAVWVVTLVLFPLALWWVGRGLYAGSGMVEIAFRVFLAWALYKAPSLYILVLGRDLPWQIVAIVGAGILSLSTWQFGVLGLGFSVVFLVLLVVVRCVYHHRKEKILCERSK